MNITEFEKGALITRNEPVKYGNSGKEDSSYCGDRIELVGVSRDAKLIFYRDLDGTLDDGIRTLSYARDGWDKGWCRYPVEFLDD